MVHLSVAHQLVERYGSPPSPAFYLGNIAPDAIHMRPGMDRAGAGAADGRRPGEIRAAKLAVHLVGEGGLDEGRLGALLSRRGQGTEEAASIADMATGYAAHVLTDVYWREDLILPFRARHEERLLREQMSVDELRALYYAECDKVDLELYDRQPWRPRVWALLRAARALDVDGLLSADEIAGWRDRVLSWFATNRHKAGYTLRYLTLERVLAFIDDAAARVHERLASAPPAPAPMGRHTSSPS